MTAVRGNEDRVAVHWPCGLRPVVQAVHYRLAPRSDTDLRAGVFCRDWVGRLPTQERIADACRGTPNERLKKSKAVALKISCNSANWLMREVLKNNSNHPITHRALALLVHSMLGKPKNLADARRGLRQLQRVVHPDKISGLQRACGVPVTPQPNYISKKVADCLALVAQVLDHPHYGKALFVPGRLTYGQWGANFWSKVGRTLRSYVRCLKAWVKRLVAVAQGRKAGDSFVRSVGHKSRPSPPRQLAQPKLLLWTQTSHRPPARTPPPFHFQSQSDARLAAPGVGARVKDQQVGETRNRSGSLEPPCDGNVAQIAVGDGAKADLVPA